MISRDKLIEEATRLLERSKTSIHIKSPDGYANHCYATGEKCKVLFEKAYDNNEDIIPKLLDPRNTLLSYNTRKHFIDSGHANGLMHDIGDAYVCDELQLLASHFGRLLLEFYGFPNDISFSVGSSWVAEEELKVAQSKIKEGSAPPEMKRNAEWIMGLDPYDYVQESVQQIIGTVADIGDDFDSRIEKYVDRRTDWGHHSLVEALTNDNNAGIERLRSVYMIGNNLIEGKMDPEYIADIGVIPLA